MQHNNKMSKKQNLTLGGINSLKNVVEEVQTTEVKNEENKKDSMNEVPASINEEEHWKKFVEQAKGQSLGTAKAVVYIPSDLKMDLENLRNIPELSKVSLSSLVTTALDMFIEDHLRTIKHSLNKHKSRF